MSESGNNRLIEKRQVLCVTLDAKLRHMAAVVVVEEEVVGRD